MSMDQSPVPPDWAQPPVVKRMSTATKVLIALGIIFAVMILFAFAAVLLIAYYGHKYMSQSVSNDPVRIVAVSDELARIDVPDGLAPQVSLDMRVPFTDDRFMVWVVYADQQSDSSLVLMAMGAQYAGGNPAQWRQSAEGSMRQQGMHQEDVVVETSSQKQVTIHGESATFTIAEGVGRDSQSRRIEVSGAFQGKDGPVMLLANLDAEKFPRERVVEMLESIE